MTTIALTRGILHFYTDQKDFEESLPAAKLMRDLGCPRDSIGADEVVRIEPALAGIRDKIVGGDFTATDESGDVYKFTTGLAKKARRGRRRIPIQHHRHAPADRRHRRSAHITGVEVIDAEGRHQVLRADAFVMAMGSFSVPLVNRWAST